MNESSEEDDEIIINDEYYDEQSSINTVPTNKVIPSSYIFKVHEGGYNHIPTLESTNNDEEELNGKSEFIYFDKEDISEKIEDKYLEKIKKFQEENKKLKLEIERLKKNASQSKPKTVAKSNSSINQDKYDKLNDQYLQTKKELEIALKNNEILQNQIDGYKAEFSCLRSEMVKKSDKISELQQQIYKMENDIATTRVNDIKKCYYEVLNKYNETSKESEKENESVKKPLVVDKQDRTIDFINSHYSPEKKNTNHLINCNHSLSISKSNSNLQRKKINSAFSMTIFPSQKEEVLKESKILEIETELYKLQKERDKLNDDLSKIPEFPKQKAQINKRRGLEIEIEEFNKKINYHKKKLRELNNK